MGFKDNLRSELVYSGMSVKELAAKSGVKKYSIDNYLNNRGQMPSLEAGYRIAKALNVTVEYLITGKELKQNKAFQNLSNNARIIVRLAGELDNKKHKFVIDFIKWLKLRNNEEI